MSVTLLRGRVLDFVAEPKSDNDFDSYEYIEDGALALEAGSIVAKGEYSQIAAAHPGAALVDHRPNLLVPGFIDTHLHFPQMQVIGSFGTKLLDWLEKYTFVEEQRFADREHCERIAEWLFDTLLRNGTTTGVAYCSVHKTSADAYFEEAEKRGLCMIGGKVLMDRNAPPGLRDTAQSGYDDTKELIGRWHGRSRLRYAISPRFAITSTPEQLQASQALVAEHPECYMQTHISENRDEIALAKSLYPDARDYLDIYESCGLLGPRSLFGHCIHLEARERKTMSESGSVAVFCPTSNLFLGSGLFDMDGLSEEGVRISVATDIGGGTSYSMLKTMDEAYKVLQLRNQVLNPLKSFYLMTRGNAEALSLENKIGTLDVGSDADIVVLNSCATPAMKLRMETQQTLSEELFVLQTLGDDRAVEQVYVAGIPSHPGAGNQQRK